VGRRFRFGHGPHRGCAAKGGGKENRDGHRSGIGAVAATPRPPAALDGPSVRPHCDCGAAGGSRRGLKKTTQAIEMFLLIDNYDSFTYNLVHYLGELGATVEVRRNDALSAAQALALAPQGIVISPGPCDPDRAG